MKKERVGVIVHRPLLDRIMKIEQRQRLESIAEVRWTDSSTPVTVDDAIRILDGCSIGVGSWKTPWPDEKLLAVCPDLRLWIHAAGTVKHMFGPHLRGRDLKIATCAPAIAEAVADITLAQIMIGLKRTIPNAEANRRGIAPAPADVMSLCDATVGVIAASEVGKRTIQRLKPFGPRILLYDPYVNESRAAEMGVTLVKDLVELCAACDAITLHTPMITATAKLLGAKHFKAMRDNAIFVNTSRGGCVDESALIAELKKGRLFAFLDVSDPEPAAADSPVRRLPNVVYTSHTAGGPDSRIGEQVVSDIEAFVNGREPLMVVKEVMLERMA